jgi:hypothetical protein
MKTEKIQLIRFIDISSGNAQEYVKGVFGVIDIIKKPAYGEGDKWFYDVQIDTGKTHRIFNPDYIVFETDQK